MQLNDKWNALQTRLAEVDDIQKAATLLSWDQQTYMPPAGAKARGEQLATLERLGHERFTDPTIGRLLEDLAHEATILPANSIKAATWRVTRRRYDRATKLPADLVAEMARTSARAFDSWVKARAESNFSIFEKDLAKQVELARRQADLYGYDETPYDALLAGYEPGLTSHDVDLLFDPLRTRLVPLLGRLQPVLDRVDDSILKKHFPHAEQIALTEDILRLIGFDFASGRQDISPHPFTTSIGQGDTRVTTAVNEHDLALALFASIHEGGHGTHDQGIPTDIARTALGVTESLVLAESQSRLWENLIGRSMTFAEHLLPYLRTRFPDPFRDVSAEALYAAGSRVEPGYIRVQADEVTYCLHIFLRYEIERELVENQLSVAELPERWWDGMKELLDLDPVEDARGVLQDVHWSYGAIGYFPTYALGTMLAVQLFEAAIAADTTISPGLKEANFVPLLSWMRNHVHRYGSIWTASELINRELGSKLSPNPFLNYLEQKYRGLYDI